MARLASRLETDVPILPIMAPPSQAECEIAGHRYLLKVWTFDQWERTEETLKPLQAQPLGTLGWFVLEPSEN